MTRYLLAMSPPTLHVVAAAPGPDRPGYGYATACGCARIYTALTPSRTASDALRAIDCGNCRRVLAAAIRRGEAE